ncbi:MAG TPA: porin family protein [Mucilaginibacter sp.]|jgi:predicted porin|nr:porin family protein [Mucilaginibacter sp.]
MKKLLLSLFVTAIAFTARAQVLPNFQFGLKGGVNLASISSDNSATFSANNQAGFLAGAWARFGALGFNFQPELYFTQKSADLTSNGGETKGNFTSIDVPLLFGVKVGALGIGARFYTGPVVSFAINKNQSFGQVVSIAENQPLTYKDQNFAWQLGAGLDLKALSFDLRYEAGLTSMSYGNTSTHINLFSLSVAYRLIKI